MLAVLIACFVPATANAAQGSWVLPATELSTAGTSSFDARVAVAPNESAVAMWADLAGSVRFAERSPGAPFSTATTLAPGAAPDVAAGPDGTVAAVWFGPGFAPFPVMASVRPPGGTFSAPVQLGVAGNTDDAPRIAIGADGTIAAVWSFLPSSGAGDSVRAAVRVPGAANFSPSVDITTGEQRSDVGPRVVVGPDGTATVSWEGDNGLARVATRPPGGSFGSPVNIGTASVATPVLLGVAADGSTTLAWVEGTSIRTSTRPPNGSFSAPTVVANGGPLTDLAVAPDGTAVVSWGRGNAGGVSVRAPGGAFGAAFPLGLVRTSAAAVGGDGTVTVLFSTFSTPGVVARTRPPGGTFGPAQTLSPTDQLDGLPDVGVGRDGGAVAVWNARPSPYIIRAATTTSSPSGCGQRVQVGFATAEGALAETSPGSGVFRAEVGDVVWVGGLELRPRFGGALVVDQNTSELRADGTGVDVLLDNESVPLAIAVIPVRTVSGQVVFNRDGTAMKSLLSFPVTGAAQLSWADGGAAARLDLEADAEAAIKRFGNLTANVALKLALRTANCTGPDLAGAEVAVPELLFTPSAMRQPVQVGVRNVLFKFARQNGVNSWTGQGEIVLPIRAGAGTNGPGLALGGNASVLDSEFAGAGIAVGGLNRPLSHGIFLQRVAGNFTVKPDFGADLSADFTWGPVVQGEKLVSATGAVKALANASGDCPNGRDPVALSGLASVPIVERLGVASVKILDLGCLYATSGAIEKTMQVDATFGDVVNGQIPNPIATLQANLRGFAGLQGVEAEGAGTITLPVVGTVGGRGLISTRAIAACAQLSFVRGGVSQLWGSPPRVFDGCDLAPWRVGTITAALDLRRPHGVTAPRSRVFQVAGGLPFAGFRVQGADAPPQITLRGPGGATFTSPSNGGALIRPNVVIVPVPHERETYVFVKSPRPGRWTLAATDTQQITGFASTRGLPRPRVTGRVSGAGRTRTLRYSVAPLAGQRVTLYERTSDGVATRIGVATRQRGTITFRPSSTGQGARIEAAVTQDGLPRDVLTIARFRARLTAPVIRRVTRSGRNLNLAWARDPRALEYRVTVRSGARRVARVTTSKTSLRVTRVPTGVLVVEVVGIPVSGPPSPPTRRTVAALRR